VVSDELMDFLQDTVAKAPDLPPEGEPEAPKPKRQRYVQPVQLSNRTLMPSQAAQVQGFGTQNDPHRQLHVPLSGVRLLAPV